MDEWMDGYMDGWMVGEWMDVCMYICMYVHMYVCVCLYIFVLFSASEQLDEQRLWYVLSCLCDVAYKGSLAAN